MALPAYFVPVQYNECSVGTTLQTLVVPSGVTAALITNLGPVSVVVAPVNTVTPHSGVIVPPSTPTIIGVTAAGSFSLVSLPGAPTNSPVYVTFGN
jgi:hypothetical protein